MKQAQTAGVLIAVLLLAAFGAFLIFKEGPSGAAQIQPVTYPGQPVKVIPQCCRTGYGGYLPSAHVMVGKCGKAYNDGLSDALSECPPVDTTSCHTASQSLIENSCEVEVCCNLL